MKPIKKFIPALFLSLACLSTQLLDAGQTQKESAPPGEDYKTVTRNGAWCWFSDPRAVVYEGAEKAAYIGRVNGFGDIVVASLDYETTKIDTAVLHAKLEADDHANPSILVRQDDRILVFYSKHSQKDGPLIMRMSTRPIPRTREEISATPAPSSFPKKTDGTRMQSISGRCGKSSTLFCPILPPYRWRKTSKITWTAGGGATRCSWVRPCGRNWPPNWFPFNPKTKFKDRKHRTKKFLNSEKKVKYSIAFFSLRSLRLCVYCFY
jgi:hypothetical protein